jgi:hypothetical protein
MISKKFFLALFYILQSQILVMRRRHMLGEHEKTLCGWGLTTGELSQMKRMENRYVNCKRCLDKMMELPELLSSRKVSSGNPVNG